MKISSIAAAGDLWNGGRTSVGSGSERRTGCERAHGHTRAVGGAHGSRAEIVGLPLEVPVDSGTGSARLPNKEESINRSS